MTQDYKTVIFEENPYASSQMTDPAQVPFIVRLLLKTHLFKSQHRAGIFLLVLTIFLFLTSVVVAKLYIFPTEQPSPPLEDLSFIEQSQLDPILVEGIKNSITERKR